MTSNNINSNYNSIKGDNINNLSNKNRAAMDNKE